ncbi:MAG TPA: FtsQ-type POTRA domain-containing protein, partial [Smithellaceae bacterium]|nr:FtsQ-type POTRA domain-containing protein [Smithellaceae bacterium]
MPKKIKTSYEIKKNRLRRRFTGGLRDVFAALCLLAAAAAIVMVFIYAYSYVLSMPYFQIKEIAVRGLAELTEKDILALAGVKPDQNLLAINTAVLERKISVNPWVEKAYVGRELPDRLVLEVKERKPLALVKQAGDFYLIDKAGVVFKKMGRSDEADLPVITGASWKGKTPSRFLPGALSLITKLSGSGQYAYLGAISEININDMFGLSLLTDSGLHLKLG